MPALARSALSPVTNLQLAEKYVYGAKPPKPASVTGTVSSTNITVNVSNNGKSASWSAGVQLPSTGS
jgi:hypothetical protein